MQLEWECPACGEKNYVDDDWDHCLQMCEYCDSESLVELEIKHVILEIGRGPGEGKGLRDKKQKLKEKRKCKGCNKDISHKHPNAKFHSKKCKDKYWNMVNPRGKFAHLANDADEYIDDEFGWDGHK